MGFMYFSYSIQKVYSDIIMIFNRGFAGPPEVIGC